MGKSELFDLAAEVKGETDKAWRLFDGTKTEWVPKFQVEDNGDGRGRYSSLQRQTKNAMTNDSKRYADKSTA